MFGLFSNDDDEDSEVKEIQNFLEFLYEDLSEEDAKYIKKNGKHRSEEKYVDYNFDDIFDDYDIDF